MSEIALKSEVTKLKTDLEKKDRDIKLLKNQINELKSQFDQKNMENHNLLDRIEELEDTIMRLEALIPEEDGKKKSRKKQAFDSKLAIELDEKDRQIRDLKNNMGFLRKEKMQLQQELNNFKSKESDSSVIRVEDLRSKPPLNVLVKELQDKVNKQRSIIDRLMSTSNDDKIEKLNQKEEEIKLLKSEILGLNEKIKEISAKSGDRNRDLITKSLIEDLQNQLTKSKMNANNLKEKLDKFQKKSKKQEKESTKINSYKSKINELKNSLKLKENEIKDLKNKVVSLQKAEIVANFEQNNGSSSEMMKRLKDDLQDKLNRSKQQIKMLQDQMASYQQENQKVFAGSQKDLEAELKMVRDMARLLQNQLDTKDVEIQTIKNEAVQIKGKYRQLENQLRQKDQKIDELSRQLDSNLIQTQIQPKKEDPNLELRVRELKNKVENLQKVNNEQKIEISQLRKKI
ncbi:MAG: hypothetical protein ACFE9Z_09000 [Promethearchaeota archaeon]